MNKKYKELFSNTAIFAISNVLSKLILSLLLPLYTRTLTTEMYGRAELITTIAELLIPVCSFAIQDALFRYGMEKRIRREEVLKNSILILSIATGLLFAASLALKHYEAVGSLYIMFWAVACVSMWRGAFSLYSKTMGKTVIFAIDSVLYNTLLGIFNVVFLLAFGLGLNGYFLAMISAGLGSTAYLAVNINSTRIIFYAKYNAALLKDMLQYSIPLIFNSVSWGLTHVVDKVMLTNLCGSGATGIYSAASKIPSLLSLITGIFTQAWTLSAIKDYQTDRDRNFYSSIFNITHFSVCIGTLGILAFNNNLLLTILGEDFADSVKYAPVLLMGSVFLAYSNFYSPVYSAMKRSKQIMYSSVGGGIVNVILNAVLIPREGIMGACLATALSYAFIAAYRIIDCRRRFPLNISYQKWIISVSLIAVTAYATVEDRLYFLIIGVAAVTVLCMYKSIFRQTTSHVLCIMRTGGKSKRS